MSGICETLLAVRLRRQSALMCLEGSRRRLVPSVAVRGMRYVRPWH